MPAVTTAVIYTGHYSHHAVVLYLLFGVIEHVTRPYAKVQVVPTMQSVAL